MAKYQCKVCQGVYTDPQRDGSRYYHACGPIHNPDYDAQFTLSVNGDRVAKGVVDPDIPEMIPRANARNENVTKDADGNMTPIADGPGKDTLP